MKEFIEINGHRIGKGYPPYIVAELSANHNGDLQRALRIIEEAKIAGAHAVKIQTFTPDTITLDHESDDFMIRGGLWDGKSLYELYEDAHLPWKWHKQIFDKARDVGITLFSSPFDHSAVDFLESLEAPAYKIASFEIIDLPLIARVAQTGKPIILSTGMADKTEITEAIQTAYDNGNRELIVLHCVSGYPAPADEYNLRTIEDLSIRFDVISGLSDHTITNATAISAVALGASLIEKHVTLDHDCGGVDDSFSINPEQLANLCRDVEIAWNALGKVNYERTNSEKGNIKYRRSLYVVKDIKAGEEFSTANIRSIRPGFGLSPKNLERVLGKKSKTSIPKGTALKRTHIE